MNTSRVVCQDKKNLRSKAIHTPKSINHEESNNRFIEHIHFPFYSVNSLCLYSAWEMFDSDFNLVCAFCHYAQPHNRYDEHIETAWLYSPFSKKERKNIIDHINWKLRQHTLGVSAAPVIEKTSYDLISA